MSTESDVASKSAVTTSENRSTVSAFKPVGAVKLGAHVVDAVNVTTGPAV